MNAPNKRPAKLSPGIVIGVLLAVVTGNAIGRTFVAVLSPFHPGDATSMAVSTAGFLIYPVAGYFGWKALRQSVAGAGAAFWSSQLGRFLIGRVVGAVLYALLL